MKPDLQLPTVRVEQGPSMNEAVIGRELNGFMPENDPGNGIETVARKSELGAAASDVAITSVLPAPVADGSDDVVSTTTSMTPAVASDDDLIEKEWVDKAKKIVAETKDDPYKREESVSKLQADYLKKRYGREVGITK
ncbi:MAG: hypothetical protein WCI79_02795 [Candidatus Saccharibacteria bacterium]